MERPNDRKPGEVCPMCLGQKHLHAWRNEPSGRMTVPVDIACPECSAPGAPAEPRHPGDGRLAATPGLWSDGAKVLRGRARALLDEARAFSCGGPDQRGMDFCHDFARTVELFLEELLRVQVKLGGFDPAPGPDRTVEVVVDRGLDACETCQGRGVVDDLRELAGGPFRRTPCPDCQARARAAAPAKPDPAPADQRPGHVKGKRLGTVEWQGAITFSVGPDISQENDEAIIRRVTSEARQLLANRRATIAARCTPEAEARRRELQDQEAQTFLAAAERVTGYTSPYLRNPQPAAPPMPPPDMAGMNAGEPWTPTSYAGASLAGPFTAAELDANLRRLASPSYVPPDKVGVPRLAGLERSAWGRRLELLAAGLVGAILAWGASHLGR